MSLLNNCELWFLRADKDRPNNKFDKENPTWEVQIRTTSKEQKKEWEALNLNINPEVPDEGPPFWKVNLKKGSKKKDGSPSDCPRVVDGDLEPIDPSTVGNCSIGNVRIYQYEFPGKDGKTAIGTLFMGLQVTTLVEFERKPREEFAKTTTKRIPVGAPDAPAHDDAAF